MLLAFFSLRIGREQRVKVITFHLCRVSFCRSDDFVLVWSLTLRRRETTVFMIPKLGTGRVTKDFYMSNSSEPQ